MPRVDRERYNEYMKRYRCKQSINLPSVDRARELKLTREELKQKFERYLDALFDKLCPTCNSEMYLVDVNAPWFCKTCLIDNADITSDEES